jgi:hypothetical protein
MNFASFTCTLKNIAADSDAEAVVVTLHLQGDTIEKSVVRATTEFSGPGFKPKGSGSPCVLAGPQRSFWPEPDNGSLVLPVLLGLAGTIEGLTGGGAIVVGAGL